MITIDMNKVKQIRQDSETVEKILFGEDQKDPKGQKDPENHEKWYAIQRDRSDPWDDGTWDYEEALRLLDGQNCGLIAVINTKTGYCEREILYEDI